MAYSSQVIDHYENPRNVGSFDKNDTDVGTGMVGAPACGCGARSRRPGGDTGREIPDSGRNEDLHGTGRGRGRVGLSRRRPS